MIVKQKDQGGPQVRLQVCNRCQRSRCSTPSPTAARRQPSSPPHNRHQSHRSVPVTPLPRRRLCVNPLPLELGRPNTTLTANDRTTKSTTVSAPFFKLKVQSDFSYQGLHFPSISPAHSFFPCSIFGSPSVDSPSNLGCTDDGTANLEHESSLSIREAMRS